MRYSINSIPENPERLDFDVVIIGCGIAGLYTALSMDEKYSCCVLTKERAEESSSWLAQGGIAAALALDDKPVYHLDDTMLAGAGLCDRAAVELLVSEGPLDVRKLIDLQVPFDLDEDGELDVGREGGHRRRRILHAGGDATGRETVKVLSQLVSRRKNVTFLPHCFCADILTNSDGEVTGCIVLDGEDRPMLIGCACLVIATGGIGQAYKSSTNPSVATGDGLAAAVRAGAELKDMEFIQFHPTGLWSEKSHERSFLISEALRGEGALLKNASGERFMQGHHELAELAPRDIVAREIFREMTRSGTSHVFLDASLHSAEYLSGRFPTIFSECQKRGIDISKDPIPVCPVQHYLIGGIKTDLDARTGVPGLYACGEAASTGVHGANRLASNSMLECLVFGRRAAQNAGRRLSEMARRAVPELPVFEKRPETGIDTAALHSEIQELMTRHCGVLRNKKGLSAALTRISDISNLLEGAYAPGRSYLETLSLSTIAAFILRAALSRDESVGAHYRED